MGGKKKKKKNTGSSFSLSISNFSLGRELFLAHNNIFEFGKVYLIPREDLNFLEQRFPYISHSIHSMISTLQDISQVLFF